MHDHIKMEGVPIDIYGTSSSVEKCYSLLQSELIKRGKLSRIEIQDLIMGNKLKCHILYEGSGIYNPNSIWRNARRIKKNGCTLTRNGKLILSKSFYEYIIMKCGSIAHYNIVNWCILYRTLDDFISFFKKNELGSDVLSYVRTEDQKRIVRGIYDILGIKY